ncbi:DegT/DnrJ/EryC1/StrS family aminotransferase [Brevibacillus sp. SYP-B805]|uniref:DegT/DnrJ/EryC1/StrS family aminotransferase n=1 Tax=Brevibacillus sp. SYP-B805 TaxID=1578199 RepID=UPI0013EC65A4|nr:DegT/DnrJ/EryC1/StrS family aminotransferase [Brevibacillus sp. SYP-B805]NGQ95719.1 DegT/DnrJ/EryC1/StrS family aminotransferase [Brevibacillus sp. SYP-B805]
MIPLVDLRRQFHSIRPQILAGISDVIESGSYILGAKVAELEQRIAERLGVAHAIAVANGTDALILTLEAYGIGPGDEVLTTPFTFFASAEAVSRVGAKPVFVDIDPDSYNLDPTKLEEKITPAAKAIIPVHLFGQPAEMDAISHIARKHGLVVIEDACQAFGAAYKGNPVGSLGDAACFSFFPTKNLGTLGDGGLVVTNDDAVAARIRLLRQHGSTKKYVHETIGYNSRLDEIHAAILLTCLEHIDAWNDTRRRLAARYREGLQEIAHLRIAPESPDVRHIYHLFCLETQHRPAVMRSLQAEGIQCAVYYPLPLHLQRVYADLGYKKGDCPVSERLSEQLFAIPMSPFLQEAEQDRIIGVLREVTAACDSE